MRKSRVATRYARALLLLTEEGGLLEKAYRDMKTVLSTSKNSKELRNLLKSPIIKTDKKQAILTQIFNDHISKVSMMFINTITSKKRESLLPSIADSFIIGYKKHIGIRTATVTSAIELDEDLKGQIIKLVKDKEEGSVELVEVVDKNIIGGVIIRMDDKQLDMSLSNTISELKQTFNKNLYIQDF